MNHVKKRRPIIAFLLSFVTPGLGQIYNGRFKKGIILYLIDLLIVVILMFSGLFSIFYGAIISLVIILGFSIFIWLDALFDAIKLKEVPLKRYNKWYIYLVIFLISAFVVQPVISSAIKKNVVRAYKIPASSMEPTLLVGDYFLVDMKIYKSEKPKRGDIVIFEFPKDPSKDFIKRVIATEGEKIEIIRNKIYINDQLIDDPWSHFTMPRSSIEDYGPVRVPEGSLFVMGDNRDNSQDSRFWGFVKVNKVKGKAFIIYFSWDGYAQTLLNKIRWTRLWKLIH
jgi:signal peptidase I